MNEESIPKPQTEMAQIPPIPPIQVGTAFEGDANGKNPFHNKKLLSPENIQELPEHLSLFMEIPLKIIEAYDREFEKYVEIAFCLNCGELKKSPWSKCVNCSYQPKILKELAAHFATISLPLEYKTYSSAKRLELGNYIENYEKLNKIVANVIFKKSQDVMIDLREKLS